ncbi:RNA-dependent RNA polymerase [Tacheng Tick Virus 7]|uniref:Replicase n=1 Tax=Tacheng Tick Virus 7 TaxID=1608089 RepID=A0A0B5KXG9_9RHAB|nr:RNA-dependent RNA polymerase [Tacheng Tick Virus 7]AJG39148.1 RNA-dependent RNA polymerase [Tacheng Tick Virus 7]
MTSRGNNSYPDTHLNSPIRSFIHQAVIEGTRGHCNKFKYDKCKQDLTRLLTACERDGRRPKALQACPATGQAKVLAIMGQNGFQLSQEERQYCDWVEIAKKGLEFVSLQIQALPEPARPTIDVDTLIPSLAENSVALGYLRSQSLWEYIIFLTSSSLAGVSCDKSAPFYHRVTPINLDQGVYRVALDDDHQLYLSKFNALLVGPDHSQPHSPLTGWFFGRETLLMYGNLISERACLILSSIIAGDLNTENLLNFAELKTILGWGDALISHMGRDAYKVIKCYEPLTLGVMLSSHNEPYCDNKKFLQSTIKGLDSVFTQYPMARTLTNILTHFLESLDIHKLSQAFGLYRCWGHPSIDTTAGISKVKQLAQAPKMMDHDLITKIQRKFKELLFISYRRKHKLWPKFSLDPGGKLTYLGNQLDSGHMFSRRHHRYRLSDWDYVVLEKTVDIEDNFNLSTLLSDKAVSPSKSEVVASVANRKGIPYVSRRVIMAWLKSNYTTARAFLKEIQEAGFSTDDLIIGVCPKEREMKMEPRLFAVMTMKVRLYFVLTESLLAEHMLPLFPQVTMIDDAIKLTKKIYHATRSMGDKEITELLIPIITNIDFEKWNLNMRAELVNPIFRVMDQFFGFTNVFERTHDIFEQSTIYLTDNTLEMSVDPSHTDLADGPGVWHGHKGGFEGLRQKGWTIVTIILLELVSDSYPLRHTIMGQGDNQVIISRLTSHHREQGKLHCVKGPREVRMIHASFLESLADTLERVGLPLKASETWSSCRLFMYGKEMYWDSMPLAMSQKRIARMFPLANELYPSLENALSTIFCNGNSAALSDISPLHAFIIGVIQAIHCIRSHMAYSPLIGDGLMKLSVMEGSVWSVVLTSTKITRRLPVKDVEKLFQNHQAEIPLWILLFPKVLGGYPVQSLLDFMNRGFPDPVSQWISLLKKLFLLPCCPDILKRVCCAIVWPEFSPDINASMLLEDPISVNALMPTNGAGVIRKQVEDWMQHTEFIQNQSFKDMMTYAFTSQAPIDILLAKGDIYWPRLMHDIRDATVGGYAKSFIDKIAKTSTSMEVARTSSVTPLVPKIRQAEKRYFNSVIYKLGKGDTHLIMPTCSAKHADWLRRTGWKKDVMAGVTTPHPLEIFDVTVRTELGCATCNTDDTSRSNYIVAKISDDLRQHPTSYLTRIGDSVPYLGSSTTEKVKAPVGMKLINTTPLLKRALSLLRANNWFVSPDDPLGRLLRRLVQSMTDMNPEIFETPTVSKTGSADHRYHDSALKHGGFNMTKYNAGTFLHLVTTTLSRYSKGSENVTLHYQASLCYLQGLFSIMLNYHLVTQHHCALHAHLSCPECVVKVYDEDIKGDPLLDLIEFPSLRDNPLLWVPKEQIAGLTTPHKFETVAEYSHELMHFGVALELVKRALSIRDELEYELGTGSSLTAPLVWGMSMDSLKLLEACCSILLIVYLSKRKPLAWADIDDSVVGNFFNWLTETQLSYLSPLGIIFYDSYSRLRLSTSLYGIKSPSSAPPTNRAVQKATLAAIQAVILMRLEGVMRQWASGFKIIWGGIDNPYDSLSLAITYHALISPHETLTERHYRALILAIRETKAQEQSEKTDIINAVKATVLNPSDQSLQPALSGAVQRKLVEVINRLPLQYSGASADYLQKSYKGPTNKDRCVQAPVRTLTQPQLAMLPKAAYLLWDLERERDYDPYELWRIPEESIPPVPVEYYSHFYRPDPLDSTAHYKITSVLHASQLLTRRVLYALSGGDGTGGNTLTLLRLYPDARVYYNTLVSFHDIVPQILGEFSPASFDGHTGWTRRLIGFQDSVEGVTDLTDPLLVDQVSSVLGGNLLDLVVSDMEGGGWTDPDPGLKLANNVCRISHIMSPNGAACVKYYASNRYALAAGLLTISQYFAKVSLWRSEFTSSKSTECYILAVGPLHHQQTDDHLLDTGMRVCQVTPTKVLLDHISDLRRRMEQDTLPRANLASSRQYSAVLRTEIHTHALERELLALLKRANLVSTHNTLDLYRVFEKLFQYSGKLLNPKAVVSHKLISIKISEHVDTDKAWNIISVWCMAIVVMLASPDLVERSLKTMLEGWLIGYQTVKGNWGFIIASEALVPGREGYCSRGNFFQRRVGSFSSSNKWAKRIMKMASLLSRKVSFLGLTDGAVQRIDITWGPAPHGSQLEQNLGVSAPSACHWIIHLPAKMTPRTPPHVIASFPLHEWMRGAHFLRL